MLSDTLGVRPDNFTPRHSPRLLRVSAPSPSGKYLFGVVREQKLLCSWKEPGSSEEGRGSASLQLALC